METFWKYHHFQHPKQSSLHFSKNATIYQATPGNVRNDAQIYTKNDIKYHEMTKRDLSYATQKCKLKAIGGPEIMQPTTISNTLPQTAYHIGNGNTW
jgi:hypothetical protein